MENLEKWVDPHVWKSKCADIKDDVFDEFCGIKYFQFMIICTYFLIVKRAASIFSLSPPPSAPIKAVFLQHISSWWRQTRALEVEPHWAYMADDVCESVQREKAVRKKTNKHKNGSLSPARSTCFPPNLRRSISKFSNFSSKMLSGSLETREDIKSCSFFSSLFFLACCFFKSHRNNISISLRVREKKLKELLGAAWSPSFDQFSQLNGNKLCCSLLLQRLRRRRAEAQRTLPNGYKSGFPHRITCLRKIKLDLCFSRENGFFLWCRWELTGSLLEPARSEAMCWSLEDENKATERARVFNSGVCLPCLLVKHIARFYV